VPPVNWLAERVRHYFDQHPEVYREEFLLEAVRREIHFREQRATGNGAGPVRRQGQRTNRWSTARPPLSAEDIRIHAWLTERLAVLHYERYGLWPKLRRFLLGNRLVRWLGLQRKMQSDIGGLQGDLSTYAVPSPGTRFRVSQGRGSLPGRGEPCGSYDWPCAALTRSWWWPC
jgi:hypothetical protein